MLIVSYYNRFRYDFSLERGKEALISSRSKSVLPITELQDDIVISNEDDQLFYQVKGQKAILEQGTEIEGIVFYIADEDTKVYTPLDQTEVLIGSLKGYDITFTGQVPQFLLKRIGSVWALTL